MLFKKAILYYIIITTEIWNSQSDPEWTRSAIASCCCFIQCFFSFGCSLYRGCNRRLIWRFGYLIKKMFLLFFFFLHQMSFLTQPLTTRLPQPSVWSKGLPSMWRQMWVLHFSQPHFEVLVRGFELATFQSYTILGFLIHNCSSLQYKSRNAKCKTSYNTLKYKLVLRLQQSTLVNQLSQLNFFIFILSEGIQRAFCKKSIELLSWK